MLAVDPGVRRRPQRGLQEGDLPFNPYTARDVVAVGALLAARFGANGGSEPRRAMFLDALRKRLGEAKGKAVFDDLRAADDGESPTIDPGRFAFHLPPAASPGQRRARRRELHAGGALGAASSLDSRPASNALLLGAKRSKTGRPILVGGPQVGYFFPQFFMEVDLHGGGYDVRGALLPGLPLVLIGRGPDFAWTVTSSQGDNIDTFAETLCAATTATTSTRAPAARWTCSTRGPCVRPAGPTSACSSSSRRTASSRATRRSEDARRARAATLDARSRGLERACPLRAEHGSGHVGRELHEGGRQVEAMFNLFYADDRDIAHVTAGRLPIRAPGTDPALPTIGTGEYDWRGFLGAKAHPQTVNPASGAILDWNSKPARGWGAADGNWSYGSVQRKDLLTRRAGHRQA